MAAPPQHLPLLTAACSAAALGPPGHLHPTGAVPSCPRSRPLIGGAESGSSSSMHLISLLSPQLRTRNSHHFPPQLPLPLFRLGSCLTTSMPNYLPGHPRMKAPPLRTLHLARSSPAPPLHLMPLRQPPSKLHLRRVVMACEHCVPPPLSWRSWACALVQTHLRLLSKREYPFRAPCICGHLTQRS